MSAPAHETVAVLGAGTMGSGIAQACATAGHSVLLYDVDESSRQRGLDSIRHSAARLVKRGSLSEEDSAAMTGRVSLAASLAELGQATVFIEAVFEDLKVKEALWKQLAEVAAAGALLATNTSSLSVTQIAAFSGREADFCGMHFFNPVPLMPLVEVIRGVNTAEVTIGRATDFATGLGKSPVVCGDTPGFLVNRLLIPYLNDAVHALADGIASAEDIDKAMKLGANMPIGPLALGDLVGLDVALAAAESLHAEFQDPKFRVAPLLRQMVRAGKLGRKSGSGFFEYDNGGN